MKYAANLLRYCKKVVLRESTSYEYVSKMIGESNLMLIPDALFSWGEKFRKAAIAIRQNPEFCIPFQSNLSANNLDFTTPYVCVSASSSAWRYGKKCEESLIELVNQITACGYLVYLVETCAGDCALHSVSRATGAILIPQHISVLAGAGILAGATAYVTGRYHPAIMAAAGGVPTIFMGSNSHKTKSIQKLLGYDKPLEFPIAATKKEILEIVEMLKEMILHRDELSQKIISHHTESAKKTELYRSLVFND
jgi:polysaccharide pyruvyl transferase WcaK-like protein